MTDAQRVTGRRPCPAGEVNRTFSAQAFGRTWTVSVVTAAKGRHGWAFGRTGPHGRTPALTGRPSCGRAPDRPGQDRASRFRNPVHLPSPRGTKHTAKPRDPGTSVPSGRSWQVLVTTRPRHHCATDGLTRMTDDILHGAESPTPTLPDAFQVDQTAATVHTEPDP